STALILPSSRRSTSRRRSVSTVMTHATTSTRSRQTCRFWRRAREQEQVWMSGWDGSKASHRREAIWRLSSDVAWPGLASIGTHRRPHLSAAGILAVHGDARFAQLVPHGEIQFASERAGGLQVVSAPYLQMESEPTKTDLHELHLRRGRAQHTFMPR